LYEYQVVHWLGHYLWNDNIDDGHYDDDDDDDDDRDNDNIDIKVVLI
jgi:hypothetical protein